MSSRSRRSSRRGNFAVLFALTIVVVLGFGALAVDISFVRLAQSQAQDVADAASQGAMMVLRRTGSISQATAAAEAVCARNLVAGAAPDLEDIDFGIWDQDAGTFSSTTVGPNSVRVQVGRSGSNAVGLFLGPIFGVQEANVSRTATSAGRTLDVVLVMDITGSWHSRINSQRDFLRAREAAVAFLDVMEGSYGDGDRIGMSIFTNRYAWEFTPFTYIRDEVASGAARSAWGQLNVASKAGRPRGSPSVCTLNGNPNRNNFAAPAGGCYPNMPREYVDEPGTDHTTGMTMARTMFSENPDPAVYRAMVVLTDGQPNGLGATSGQTRAAQGHVEGRWRQYTGPVPHTTAEIEADSVALAQQMWDDQRVHTWVVSFVEQRAFMQDMVHGDGYFVYATNSAALSGIFEDIAKSLPLTIVE